MKLLVDIRNFENLPPSKEWVDKDYIILHACFQCVKDFVEKENGFDFPPGDEENTKIFHELYDWWMIRKDEEYDVDDETTKKDDEMLLKLIKIRKWLWI